MSSVLWTQPWYAGVFDGIWIGITSKDPQVSSYCICDTRTPGGICWFLRRQRGYRTQGDIFSGSLPNFTLVCRVPSERVSRRGSDSIGRPLPHPCFGCLIGPPAVSTQMNGTLLTPNLCRLWYVLHLSSSYTAGCRREEYPLVFFLSSWRLMEAEPRFAWGNRRHHVCTRSVQDLRSFPSSPAFSLARPVFLFVPSVCSIFPMFLDIKRKKKQL